MAGEKVGDAESEKRTNIILGLLIDGYQRRDIIEYIREQTDWGIQRAQIDNYIRKANDELEELAKFERSKEFGRAIVRLSKLYKQNMELKENKDALEVLKEIHKLYGLYAPQTVLNLNRNTDISEEELDKELIAAGIDPETLK